MENNMNDLWQKKIDELINIIKDSEEYQKYQIVYQKMQKNKKIMTIIQDIKKLQKELVKRQSKGQDIKELDDEINHKLNLLQDYPLYLEYTYLQEDLNNVIALIKSNIEKYIDTIIN